MSFREFTIILENFEDTYKPVADSLYSPENYQTCRPFNVTNRQILRPSIMIQSNNSASNRMTQLKPEYMNCILTFNRDPNDLIRILSASESENKLYDRSNPQKLINTYLFNYIWGNWTGNTKTLVIIRNLKLLLTRSFSDQWGKFCLNWDLVMLRQPKKP